MLGERGPQPGLFAADTMYLSYVGRTTFYGFLAVQRGTIFRDEDFADLYCLTNGRPRVPPSLLATALVLQTYEGVSDDEAKRRANYDLQWKVALGVELDARPFAKSALQEFRAQLVIHDEQQAIFRKSRVLAKQDGEKLAVWAEREGFGRYVTNVSVKGQAEIDWSDVGEWRQFLQAIVAEDRMPAVQVRRSAMAARARRRSSTGTRRRSWSTLTAS